MNDTVHYEDVEMLHDPHESVKVQGGPGSGKTTYAYSTLARLLSDDELDISLPSGTWVTYRRALADDTIDKLANTGLISEDEAEEKKQGRTRWISTLHAVCYRALDEAGELQGLQAADDSDKADFIETEYSGGYWDGELSEAKQAAMDMLDWCKKNQLDPWAISEECPHYSTYLDWQKVGGPAPYELDDAYESYKDERGLVDFSELLQMCIDLEVYPPLDFLIVDEAHDAYPVMAELIEMWSEEAEIMMLIGDENQVINRYEGARADFFTDFEAEQYVTLPKSYRVPADVYKTATQTLKRLSPGSRETYMSTDKGGACTIQIHSTINKTGNETTTACRREDATLYRAYNNNNFNNDMRILARTREQVKDISNLLQWLGIPFASQLSYVADWDDELLHLYHALEKVSAYVTDGEDRALSLDEIRVLYSESDAVDEAAERTVDYMRRSGVSEADASTVVENAQARDGFLDGIGTKQPTANSQFNLGAETEKMLDNALLSGTQIDQTEVTINVQTIHSAKGLESPSVILYDAIPAPPDDMVEVANLYYVALTRASETCMVFTDAWGQQYDGMVPRGSTYTTGPSAVQRLIINQGGGA